MPTSNHDSIYCNFRSIKREFGFNVKIKFLCRVSLGEYTALAATDCLNLSEVALLLKKEGKAMQNSLPKEKVLWLL